MSRASIKAIRGGRLLDVRGHKADFADILICDDTITEIGPPGMEAPSEAQTISAEMKLMHPGLVNSHMHGHGNLSKGMGDRWTLELLLTAGGWINGGRTLEDKYLSTYIGAVEMLLKGCTACYDLTAEFPLPSVEGLDACARAYADAGIRAVVAPMVAEYTFYESIPGLMDVLPPGLKKDVERFRLGPADACLAIMRTAIENWSCGGDLVRPAIAPTIPHHCSDEFLRRCGALARESGVGIHSHVQESKVQVIAGLKRYGRTQTAHLQELGLLGPDFTVAHGVWLDHDDMSRLADNGSSVAHNPGSNMRLGNGLADVRGMLRRKVNVGIGTDGANCSDNLNMYEAMRLASFASRVQTPSTDEWLTTEEVVEAATVGGARALGLENQIGRIEKGYKADIVFLDLNHVNWIPCNDATNQLVHTEDGSAVHSVMVGGRMVVENYAPVGIDLHRLAANADAARERLERVNTASRCLCDQLSVVVNAFCPGLAKTPYHISRYVCTG